jgi:hypothetical protein
MVGKNKAVLSVMLAHVVVYLAQGLAVFTAIVYRVRHVRTPFPMGLEVPRDTIARAKPVCSSQLRYIQSPGMA